MITSGYEQFLNGKRIIVGVCGGIAAYKIAYLIRLLVKCGAEVKVVMTPDATAFIGTVTLATLSKNAVASELYNKADGTWHNHVELGLWADLMLIAPATANTISKMASGICNNILMATYLSARCPVMVAPAMDIDMWTHFTTQKNITTLKSAGLFLVDPANGELASGLFGEGRMAEPEIIIEHIIQYFYTANYNQFRGKKILITAGPTHEPIDPVRFISNHSSGKMGFALAEAFALCGASVTVIHGPVAITSTIKGINTIAITTAKQLFETTLIEFSKCSLFIAAAAVADFTPTEFSSTKIKKTEHNKTGFSLEMQRTKDVLLEMSKQKTADQFVVGFALETNNELENARKKLIDKKLDLIILNSMNDEGAGFKHDTNKITLLDRNNNTTTFELKSKQLAAQDIVDYLSKAIHA